jgi:hypothetical protein
MRKLWLTLPVALTGAVGLVIALGAAPSQAAPPGAVVTGTVTESGQPVSGVKVLLYAWPRNSVVAALPQGARVPTTVVGSALSNSDGQYSITVTDQSAVLAASDTSSTGSYVNFEVVARRDGNADLYGFTRQLAPSGQLLTTNTDAPSAAPQRADLALTHVSIAAKADGNPPCNTTYKVKYLGKRLTVVGLASSRIKKVIIGFTYGRDQSSSLGIGLNTGLGWSQSGTSSMSTSSKSTYPGQQGQHSTLEKTEFVYWKFRVICVGDTVNPTEWAADQRIGSEGAPVAKHCSHMLKGGGLSNTWSEASEFTSGVSIANVIGGVNLSSQTGYDSTASLSFTFPVAGWLCGKNALPGGRPGLLVAGLWSKK